MKNKKFTLIAVVITMLLIVSIGGYYTLVIVPHQKAVENFEKVANDVTDKNNDLNTLILESENLIKEKTEPLDPNTLENLKTTLDNTKNNIRQVPKMESKTEDIKKQTEALSQPLDYSKDKSSLSQANNYYKKSVTQLKQITNPTNSFIEERLKEIDTIVEIQSVTETHDPNDKLNKQGGYTASVYFSDKQVSTPVQGADLVDKGNDAGGNIEVYKTKAEAEARNTYISTFDSNGLLAPGSHYVYGTIVIRTSNHLTASQQHELTEKIYQKLIEVK